MFIDRCILLEINNRIPKNSKDLVSNVFSTEINWVLGTPALWVPRGFARALYASLNLVASKIITFYPEVVAQI